MLLVFAGATTGVAKGLGFTSGAVCSYIGNKNYTFKVSRQTFRRGTAFALLYIGSLLINISVNEVVIMAMYNEYDSSKVVALSAAFLVATAMSMTMNFLGLKFVVFRH